MIIYLDQNFVSDMAKAKFVGDPSFASKPQDYAALYDRLKMFVDGDRAICPGSIFHSLETIKPELAETVQRVVASLSYGLCFRDPWEILRFQAYRAAKEFLNLPSEGTPEWEIAFEDNPQEPVERGSGFRIAWQTDTSPPRPKQYMNDRKAASGKFTWADLPKRTREQEDGLIQHLYGNQIDERSVGQASLLWAALQPVEALKERLAGFLKSDHLRNCPFINILCTLNAAMDCEEGRQPRESDALDTLIMAGFLPYCDIVATSKDMVALLGQTHLADTYPSHLYSAKPEAVQAFANHLATL